MGLVDEEGDCSWACCLLALLFLCSVVSSSASRPGHLKKMASQRLSSKRMERGRGRQMERGRGRQERGRGRQMERERSLFTGMADNKEFEFA